MEKTTRLGPKPWRASAEGDQGTGQRVLTVLAEQMHPVTTPELVELSDLHVNTVRAHLRELTAAGLVSMSTVPSPGRGRPAHSYEITDAGRIAPRASDPVFAEYRGLTTAFATHLAAHADDPSVEAREIGHAWGRQLVAGEDATTTTPTGLVVRLLARLGFTPVARSETAGDEGISLRTCPLLELAEEMPEVICQVHQGLIEGALAESGATSTQALLVPFSEPGACRLHLRDTRSA